ncbi:hypothetical protein M413DRAFT_127809 [Hebeloma cylindrosporum]|uniref:F-box domain-containing protein n=1 Tax=Hebeloma cylindrosporum TaxID=76867 RepID=A0A0C2YMC9_HEBCY|nr:hypothetical protein M413DRAFT_127809 [Hebeloma cylindrosporum h7]
MAATPKISRSVQVAKTQAVKFESLPPEILGEIYIHLGWKDILVSRTVSRRLFEISKSRPIWLFLLRQCSMMLPRPPTLDRSVDLYTTQELEDLVVSRISAEVAWRSRKDPRIREITFPEGFGGAGAVLVDGGRWLLVLSKLQVHYGCVLVYDLDAPEIEEPAIIIWPQDARDAQGAFFMAVDMDENEPTLTFNVSIIPESYRGTGDAFKPVLGNDKEVPIPILQVYRVTQLGNGSQAKLVSRRLNSFPLPMHGDTWETSLRGPHFARVFSSGERMRMVEIYDWKKCDENTHVKASINFRHDFPLDVFILPECKLLVICDDQLDIYNIQQLKSIPIPAEKENQQPVTALAPYFSTPLESSLPPCDMAIFSRPHIEDGMIRMAITFQRGIHGLIIPRNGDPPRVITLSNEETDGECTCLGINRVFFQVKLTIWTAIYTWPDDNAIGLDGQPRRALPLQEQQLERGRGFLFNALMDEESGRIVNGLKHGFSVLDWRLRLGAG